MSRDVIVAVVDPASVRGYFRAADGSLSQVAQFAAAADVDPSEVAAIVADLGDRFGWAAIATAPSNGHRKALPAAGRQTFISCEDAVAVIVEFVRSHPGCTRRDLASILFPGEDYSDAPTAQRVVIRVRYALESGAIRSVSGVASQPDRLYPIADD